MTRNEDALLSAWNARGGNLDPDPAHPIPAKVPLRTGAIEMICDCCKREVDYVRGSMWHGQDRICRECFFEWYDPSGPVSDEDIMSPIRIGNRVRAKFKLQPLELEQK